MPHAVRDAETGLAYTILTDSPYPCRKYYFSMETWTTDDRWLLYHEDKPDATVLHKVNESGDDVPLAADAPFFGSDRARDVGYYFKDDTLFKLDISTAEANGVADMQPGLRPQGHYTVSRSGLVVNTYQERCGIYALIITDPMTGRSDVGYRSDTRLGHCQFNPGDDETIFFVHETGGDALQRMWMYNYAQDKVRPYYIEQENDWITHETWDASGEELSFIDWPKAIKSGAKNGQSFRTIALGEYHHAAPDAYRRMYAADRTSKGQILLINGRTGKEHVMITGQFARHGDDHCHPSFNRKGDKVAFSAPGTDGICQLGMIDLSGVSAD